MRYLKAKQLLFYILRRALPAKKVEARPGLSCRRLKLVHGPVAIESGGAAPGEFRFLNKRMNLGENLRSLDWSPADASRLWQYNLHYFDYLRDPDRSVENGLALVNSWITKNVQGSRPGWEAFTASLRIVNWVQFALTRCDEEAALQFQASLFEQALWLEKNDEKHILANHYFENLKALFFAGCYLQGVEAERWLHRAKIEIIEQLDEQILADGGHYERSPQYHSLMLENILDIYALSSSNPGLVEGSFTTDVKKYAIRALDYLNTICFSTGDIPLFNDSAFGVAPTVEKLNEYAGRLFDYSFAAVTETKKIEMNDSGIYGLRSNGDMILMTCGDIGPDYQPGHTHCDFLSYELMMDGKPVIVDSGTYEYSAGAMRDYVRSTRAHNTIVIDGDEQSELWAEFRVGRRARKRFGQVELAGEKGRIAGAYRGFFGSTGKGLAASLRLSPKFQHYRNISVKLSKDSFSQIAIVDKLEGKGSCMAESNIHIHPDYEVKEITKGLLGLFPAQKSIDSVELQNADFAGENAGHELQAIASIKIPDSFQYKITNSWYCPEFGVKKSNHCIVVYTNSVMPLEIGYQIQRNN